MTANRITAEQRAALAKLASVLGDTFYLAGGAGVAAHLQHRESRDLDLFSSSDPTSCLPALEHVDGLTITNRAPGTIHAKLDGVPVSLLRYDYRLLDRPEPIADLPIPVASSTDLACMKLSAIASRGLARDFWDLHALIGATGRELSEYLAAFRTKYPAQDIGHVVR